MAENSKRSRYFVAGPGSAGGSHAASPSPPRNHSRLTALCCDKRPYDGSMTLAVGKGM